MRSYGNMDSDCPICLGICENSLVKTVAANVARGMPCQCVRAEGSGPYRATTCRYIPSRIRTLIMMIPMKNRPITSPCGHP